MRAWRRPNGWWYGVTEDGQRIALRTRDRDEAHQRLAEYKPKPRGNTVAELMTSYLAEKSDKASHERMEFAWDRLKPSFGHLTPSQITGDVCKSYTQRRRKAGVSDGTIRKELTTLRSAINHHGKNHGAVFALPAAPSPKDRYLLHSEYQALLEAAKAPHLRLFIMLALATAGRKEAILDLTWDRVSFDSDRINLGRGNRQKGRAVVKMDKELKRHLRDAYEARTSDHVIEWAGDRVKNIRHGFDTACANAGIEGVTPHVLRHTAAVWMAEARESMATIAQFLGHSDSRTTERVYARFSPDYLMKAASVLDSALSVQMNSERGPKVPKGTKTVRRSR